MVIVIVVREDRRLERKGGRKRGESERERRGD